MGIIQTLHSYWAYLTLLMLIIAVINAIIGYFSSKPFIIGKDLRISLFALIFTHIQLLLGIILYFVSERFSLWGELGVGGVMKSDMVRLLLVEHPITNILAIILITIGWSKHKKVESAKGKFGKIAFFYTLGLILLLSRIPWGQWM
ncbi:hypothetical protein [Sinomicrobium weinanense]|uniref:50S ribosomal protein L27 n=1 Tax=Sinomicrobium weinanense TaxID=2842200 RepID=A0A926JNA3_9FLAO|nr:hypothetical protein [Sinomicrobium weinanense]MBC9794420.1 hypothetical protein [Sinomicrobium weinanense]MBU3124327.1 hypothetical protein [Sinomicrobium weinanense]